MTGPPDPPFRSTACRDHAPDRFKRELDSQNRKAALVQVGMQDIPLCVEVRPAIRAGEPAAGRFGLRRTGFLSKYAGFSLYDFSKSDCKKIRNYFAIDFKIARQSSENRIARKSFTRAIGRGGIRTHGTVTRTPDFESGNCPKGNCLSLENPCKE